MLPAKHPGREPLWTSSFTYACSTLFFAYLSFQLYTPTLPIYIKALAGTPFDVGLATGFSTFAMIVTRPYLGRALDRVGRTKILLGGILALLLASILYNFTGKVWQVFLVRTLQGLGWGAMLSGCYTLVVDYASFARRGEAVGYAGMSGALGTALGPVLGLAISRENPPFRFHSFFLTSTVFVLLAFILATRLPEPKRAEAITPGIEGSVSSCLRYVLWPVLTLLSLVFSFGAIITFISLYAGYRAVENVGWFFTAFALVMIVIRPLAGKLSDTRGRAAVIIPGMLAVALAVLLLSFSESLFYFLMSGALFGIGFGAATPAITALIADLAPAQMRGVAMALYGASWDVGMGLGGTLAGVMVQFFGYEVMFRIAAGIILIGLVGFTYVGARRKGLKPKARLT